MRTGARMRWRENLLYVDFQKSHNKTKFWNELTHKQKKNLKSNDILDDLKLSGSEFNKYWKYNYLVLENSEIKEKIIFFPYSNYLKKKGVYYYHIGIPNDAIITISPIPKYSWVPIYSTTKYFIKEIIYSDKDDIIEWTDYMKKYHKDCE